MSEWLQINSIEMLVSKSEFELDIDKNLDTLFFSCDLLNIARGRCDITIQKRASEKKNYIFISTNKPIMNASISLNHENFNNILYSLNKFAVNLSKRIKIVFILDKNLAVNNDGFLSIDKDINLEILNIKFIMPII